MYSMYTSQQAVNRHIDLKKKILSAMAIDTETTFNWQKMPVLWIYVE